MPHKKAKRSAREEAKRLQGSDLVPKGHTSLESEPIPKSIARVLEAAKLREAFKKRKRESQDDGPQDGTSQKKKRKASEQAEPLHILPGESLTHFNRRVEDNMRSQIRTAIQAGNAHQRKQGVEEKKLKDGRKSTHGEGKEKEDEKDGIKDEQRSKTKDKDIVENTLSLRSSGRKTEFEVLSTQKPKRLNDIVDAPPDLSSLTKKNKVLQGGKASEFGKGDIIPPEQKRMMEIEREKAIRRYRELKQKREGERPQAGSTIKAV